MKTSPRLLLGALLVLAATEVRAAESAATAPRPPNIVIIFMDDLGYADIGVNGAKGYVTPHLDRMAREGTRFTNFHVPHAVCSASRAALLTGCYGDRVGITGALGPRAEHGINESETTLAELLRDRGYATGMSGKWHLGHHPKFLPPRHGFDESYGLPYSNDMWPYHPVNRPGVYRPPLPIIENGQIVDPEVTAEDQRQLTTDYTARAVDFIGRNRDRPFFFYLAHSMPHVPLFVSDKFQGKSERGLYGDVIMEIDWSVGEVLRALREHDLEENTLIIFTSDNGPWLNYGDHGGSAGELRGGKLSIWEGGTRVPCLMRWPGRLPAGAVNAGYALTIDLFPTIARLVGAPLPEHTLDGRDVWPLLAGTPGATNPQEAYGFWAGQGALHAVTTGDGRWKLVLPHTFNTPDPQSPGRDGRPGILIPTTIAAPQLYDLRADPRETRDVAAANPTVVERLLGYAEKFRAELGDTALERKGRGNREPGRI